MSTVTNSPNFEDAKALQLYKREVSFCLTHYGGLSEAEAKHKVDTDVLFDVKSEMQLMLILHEYPYYWAMMILYGRDNPLWYQNPNLWPPPNDYLERFHNQHD